MENILNKVGRKQYINLEKLFAKHKNISDIIVPTDFTLEDATIKQIACRDFGDENWEKIFSHTPETLTVYICKKDGVISGGLFDLVGNKIITKVDSFFRPIEREFVEALV